MNKEQMDDRDKRRAEYIAAVKLEEAEKYKRCVKKPDLVDGAYYDGHSRNANVARWNAARKVFTHWRDKCGKRFLEDIHHPDDEQTYDVFWAWKKIDEPTDDGEKIPVWDGKRF